ncbi:MAG: HyaD/HybD family hydrogenase maturation endopeptidase [Campylobacterales bacterium]
MSLNPKIVVVGVGNVLFRDEGVGVFAAKFLEANYTFTPPIEIVDGGTLGFGLMGYFHEYERVVIVDTVSVEDEPGALYRLPSDVLMGMGSYRKTAHEVEVLEMLEICSLLEKIADVVVIGIVPEDIQTVQIGLSKPIEEAFSALIAAIVREVESYGVQVAHKLEQVPLKEVVVSFLGSYQGTAVQSEAAWIRSSMP